MLKNGANTVALNNMVYFNLLHPQQVNMGQSKLLIKSYALYAIVLMNTIKHFLTLVFKDNLQAN